MSHNSAPTLKLTGPLGADAQHRAGAAADVFGVSAWVWVEIHQAGGIEARAHWCIGHGAAALYAAQRCAQRLRKGTVVTVHASGWRIERTPHEHLVLHGVDLIEQRPAAARHEPRADRHEAWGAALEPSAEQATQ